MPVFLLIVQEFSWLGPNPDKPEPKGFFAARFLPVEQEFGRLGPNVEGIWVQNGPNPLFCSRKGLTRQKTDVE